MIQVELYFPMHVGGRTVSQSAERQFVELEEWFRESGTVLHRLMYGEIPLEGFGAAYMVTVKDGSFLVRLYVEDENLATLAKLRWGGQ